MASIRELDNIRSANVTESDCPINAKIKKNNKKIVANILKNSYPINADIEDCNNEISGNLLKNTCSINANIEDCNNEISGNVLEDKVTSATTEKEGIIRIATDDEAIEGISRDTVITPHTLRLVTHFVFEQGIASSIWVIQHNLNKQPEVTIVDSSGGKRIPDEIVYVNENQIMVKFLAPFGGKAYLN